MGGWLEHTKLRQAIKQSGSALWEDEIVFVGRLSALSGKMLHFVQQVMFYMFFEIIGPNWDKMEKVLSEATRVDQVLATHDDFLNTCLKECMLTNPKLLKGFNKLAQGIKSFAEFSDWYCRYKGPVTPLEDGGVPVSLSHSAHPGQATDALLASHATFSGLRNTPASASPLLSKMEKDFVHTLRSLMDLVQVYSTLEAPSLVHLLNMMDFNHFYSTRLAPDVGFIGSPVVHKMGVKKDGQQVQDRRSRLGQSSPLANY